MFTEVAAHKVTLGKCNTDRSIGTQTSGSRAVGPAYAQAPAKHAGHNTLITHRKDTTPAAYQTAWAKADAVHNLEQGLASAGHALKREIGAVMNPSDRRAPLVNSVPDIVQERVSCISRYIGITRQIAFGVKQTLLVECRVTPGLIDLKRQSGKPPISVYGNGHGAAQEVYYSKLLFCPGVRTGQFHFRVGKPAGQGSIDRDFMALAFAAAGQFLICRIRRVQGFPRLLQFLCNHGYSIAAALS
jgi:hypothetical protein